jgi:hypothetical protein
VVHEQRDDGRQLAFPAAFALLTLPDAHHVPQELQRDARVGRALVLDDAVDEQQALASQAQAEEPV